MNKGEILNILKKYYGFEKDIKFANFLGISSQVYSNWKSRNSFDIEMICDKCIEINPEWLISGKGDMIKNKGVRDHLQEKIKRIPFVPFQEISNYEIEELNVENFESKHFVIPTFSGVDYLTEVICLSNFPKYCIGDIIACKKIKFFDLFLQTEKLIDNEYVIGTKKGVLFSRIISLDSNNFLFFLNDKNKTLELSVSEIKSISQVIGIIRSI